MTIQNIAIPYSDFKLQEIIDPEQFDLNNATFVTKVNQLVHLINNLTEGSVSEIGGSDLVSVRTIEPFTSTNLQALLIEILAYLKSANGAGYIGVSAISGLSGTTIQSFFASVKNLYDSLDFYTGELQAEVNANQLSLTNLNTKFVQTESNSTLALSHATSANTNASSALSLSTQKVNEMNVLMDSVSDLLLYINQTFLVDVTNTLAEYDTRIEGTEVLVANTVVTANSSKAESTQVTTQMQNFITNAGDSNLEVVDARLRLNGTTASTLGAHLRETTALLADKAKQIDLEIERQRINNFIATDPTVDNVETTDIRVGADGFTYDSAGDAVRQQFDKRISKAILNNIVKNANFNGQTFWSPTSATVNSVTGNELTFTPTAALGQIRQNPVATTIAGHIYYLAMMAKSTSNLVKVDIRNGIGSSLLGINHSGSGLYENLSVVGKINTSEVVQFRVWDSRTSAWDAISVKQAMLIDLTEVFGAGNEPTKDELLESISTLSAGSTFFESDLITDYVQGKLTNYEPLKPYPLYVNVKSEIINMISKYNSSEDLRIKMNKKGVNNLFDFSFMYKIANMKNVVSRDISGVTAFNTNSSDWFAPYKVAAINNINGTNPTSEFFTGGNHGYDNSGTTPGVATGRTSALKFVVDGRTVTEYDGFCNFVDVYWSNRIQAYNTTKADGTGREVLQENYHLHYDGYKITIRNTIEFLEPVTWKTYFGLQSQRTAWNEKVLYRSSANRKWNDGALASNSVDKNTNIITLKKGTDNLDFSVDDRVGLGRKDLLTASAYNSYSSASKSYFWLVDGDKAVEQGDIFTIEGYYKFYSL